MKTLKNVDFAKGNEDYKEYIDYISQLSFKENKHNVLLYIDNEIELANELGRNYNAHVKRMDYTIEVLKESNQPTEQFEEIVKNYLETLVSVAYCINALRKEKKYLENQPDDTQETPEVKSMDFSAIEDDLYKDDFIDNYRVCLHKDGLKGIAIYIKNTLGKEPTPKILRRIFKEDRTGFSGEHIRTLLKEINAE